jgi:hypothetical protein
MRSFFPLGCLVVMVAVAMPLLAYEYDIDTAESRIKIGGRGGFALSSSWGPDFEVLGGELHPGFHGGVMVPIALSRYFVLDAGLQLTTHGTKWIEEEDDTYEDVSPDHSRSLYYVEIPAVIKLVFFDRGAVRPFLGVGPTLGYRVISFEREVQRSVDTGVRKFNIINEKIYPFDIFATGTAGLHVWAWDGYIELAVRGMLGLMDYYEGRDEKLGDLTMRNWSAMVTIGYVFDLKRKKSYW